MNLHRRFRPVAAPQFGFAPVVHIPFATRWRWFRRQRLPVVVFAAAIAGMIPLWPAAEPVCREPRASHESVSRVPLAATNQVVELPAWSPRRETASWGGR